MFKNILLATDGSAASDHASGVAVALARVHGAKLTALYVVDPYPYIGIGDTNPMGMQAYRSAALDHAEQAQSKISALAARDGAGVVLDKRVVEDATATQGIVQVAQEMNADLIVLGSHGRTGLSKLMLGSVAAKVAAESPIPVLIAK